MLLTLRRSLFSVDIPKPEKNTHQKVRSRAQKAQKNPFCNELQRLWRGICPSPINLSLDNTTWEKVSQEKKQKEETKKETRDAQWYRCLFHLIDVNLYSHCRSTLLLWSLSSWRSRCWSALSPKKQFKKKSEKGFGLWSLTPCTIMHTITCCHLSMSLHPLPTYPCHDFWWFRVDAPCCRWLEERSVTLRRSSSDTWCTESFCRVRDVLRGFWEMMVFGTFRREAWGFLIFSGLVKEDRTSFVSPFSLYSGRWPVAALLSCLQKWATRAQITAAWGKKPRSAFAQFLFHCSFAMPTAICRWYAWKEVGKTKGERLKAKKRRNLEDYVGVFYETRVKKKRASFLDVGLCESGSVWICLFVSFSFFLCLILSSFPSLLNQLEA